VVGFLALIAFFGIIYYPLGLGGLVISLAAIGLIVLIFKKGIKK
jgi:hypothetical protein